MNGTSGISGLTGGNLLDPPEPVLSRAEWERRHCSPPTELLCAVCQTYISAGWNGITGCSCGTVYERRGLLVRVIRTGRRLRGSPPATLCPACTGPMREVPGYDDYCPVCRRREELAVEREAVATGKVELTGWLEGWDVSHDV